MPHLSRDLKPVFAPARVWAVWCVLMAGVVTTQAGCAEQAWRRNTEITLNVTRMAVDSSWALAIEHQASAEDALISEGTARAAGLAMPARQAILEEVQSALVLVRQRHHAWYGKFRFIRQLHAAAVGAYEAYRDGRGTRDAFFAAMTPLLEAWRELQLLLPNGGTPDVPVADAAAPALPSHVPAED